MANVTVNAPIDLQDRRICASRVLEAIDRGCAIDVVARAWHHLDSRLTPPEPSSVSSEWAADAISGVHGDLEDFFCRIFGC